MTMDPARAVEVAAMALQEPMNKALKLGDSEIQRFYKNSVIFITGGSGFIGKQLIEKLFRSCHVSKVFMLIRPKKGKNIQERLDAILSDPVFDTIKQQKPDFVNKIVPIEGDVATLKLGLRDKDWNDLTAEVNVIFHVAATIKFAETLKVATLINVRGTREVLALGKACKNLRSHVHVSTAYTHATADRVNENIEEEFYKSPILPEAIISMVETMEEDRLVNITSELIKNWPNTYTFTKAIAEELVRTNSVGLPICIVRPAIVICTNNEPVPGWLDIGCVFGATGIVIGIGIGVLHIIFIDEDKTPGLVPCDYVNNAIIAAGKETATNQSKGGNDTRIYMICSSERNPVKWKDAKNFLVNEGMTIASPKAVYYGYGGTTTSKFIYCLMTLLLHLIPAYIVDCVCLLLGKKRRFAKLVIKLYNLTMKLSFFLTNEWNLKDDNLNKLYNTLSEQDKAIFNFDVTNLDWTQQLYIWCMGARKYIVKDGLKDTEYAIKKQKVLRVVHYVFMTLYMYGIWKLLSFVFHVVKNLFVALLYFF